MGQGEHIVPQTSAYHRNPEAPEIVGKTQLVVEPLLRRSKAG